MQYLYRNTRVWKGLTIPVLIFVAVILTACLQPRVGFQGQLTDPEGQAVPDGDYEMTVRFFTEETSGLSVYTETKKVTVESGLFNMDIEDFPPHIFSGEVGANEDTLYMEVEVNGEVLTPRRKVSGSPYAHALVAGSGVIGPRPDEANVTDGGYHAALMVANTQAPDDNPGYGISSQAANAGLFVDNVAGDGSYSESPYRESNPDIILGGEYGAFNDTQVDIYGGPGVIASDTRYDSSDVILRSNDELRLYKNWGPAGDGGSEFHVWDGPTDAQQLQLRLTADGDLSVAGSTNSPGADFAEQIDVVGDERGYEPGDVLVISENQDRAVELATDAASSRVIGVYSAQPGFLAGAGTPGEEAAQQQQALDGIDDEAARLEAQQTLKFEDGAVEVAIAGIVPVKVSAENGVIQRGDLLTTSSATGHAMKATDLVPGTILGKAMGTLDSGTGVIEVLIMLQ